MEGLNATGRELALAAVTAVLKNLLENGLARQGIMSRLGADVVFSALPPDRVNLGAEERPQLNLFLYQITPCTGLRPGLASRPVGSTSGPTRNATELALDLHYLLTAYGAQDYHTEILLGHALQVFCETPVLNRENVRTTLTELSVSQAGRPITPALAALSASDLADTVEQITIRPQFPSMEETAKLWSMLQARYRPSLLYQVSAALLG